MTRVTFALNQIVKLPNGNEESMTVYSIFASTNDECLPEDAYLIGEVILPQPIGQPSEYLEVFYSESWRTWYPLGPRLLQEQEKQGA